MRLRIPVFSRRDTLSSRRPRNTATTHDSLNLGRGSPKLLAATKPTTPDDRNVARQLEACTAPSSLLQLALSNTRRGLGRNLQLSRRSADPELKLLLKLTPDAEHRAVIEALSGLKDNLSTSVKIRDTCQALPPQSSSNGGDTRGTLSSRGRHALSKAARPSRFRRLLDQCRYPHQVVSLLRGYVDQAGTGRLALTPANSRLVIRALERFRRTSTETEILSCANAIAGIHQMRKIPYGAKLCLFGAFYAARAQSTVAMRHYISEYYESGYRLPAKACKDLMHELVAQAQVSKVDGSRFGAWQRRDALRLLTGWKSTGIGGPGEEREVSLASFVERDYSKLVLDYVKALSRLGACEAIWQEWLVCAKLLQDKFESGLSVSTRPASTRADLGHDIARAFRDALRGAGDASRAWKIDWVNPSGKGSTEPFIGDATLLEDPTNPSSRSHWPDQMDKLLDVPIDQHIKYFEKALGLNWVDDGNGTGSHIVRNEAS
ncbi:MAG: hypothetical protein M1837_003983 [Sclerophora amabilis]|nr:MAG: hypothetical protein M1837_003983 [Sclerophora amabilis]